ncbi:MAG: PAS domain S-box protein [Oligoflexia bacterium]|nr:PAS domain S-box protein [Oligoflexia bacterium]
MRKRLQTTNAKIFIFCRILILFVFTFVSSSLLSPGSTIGSTIGSTTCYTTNKIKVGNEFDFWPYAFINQDGEKYFWQIVGAFGAVPVLLFLLVFILVIGRAIQIRATHLKNILSSNERLDMAQEIAHVGSWEWDLQNNRVWWSNETYRIFGVTPQNFVPSFEANGKFIHHDDLEKYTEVFKHSLETGEPMNYDFRLITMDGELKQCLARGRVIYAMNSTRTGTNSSSSSGPNSNRPIRFIGTILDITERKKAEQELKERDIRHQELFNNIRSGIAVYEVRENGKDFILKDLNSAAEKIDGDCKENVIGKSIYEVHPGIEEVGMLDVFRRVLKTGNSEYFPTQIYKDNKINKYYENVVYRLPAGDIVFVYDDVTKRKEMEAQLEHNKQLLQTIIDNSRILVYAKDLEGRFIIASEALAQLFGHTKEQLIGKTSYEFLPKEIADQHRTNDLWVISHESRYSVEEIANTPDGINYYFTNKFPLFDAENRLYAVCGFSIDITEIKRAEEKLRLSEQRLSMAQKASRTGVWDWDILSGYMEWTQQMFDLFGLDPKYHQASFETWDKVIHPEDIEVAKQRIQRSLEKKTTLYSDYRIVLPDQQIRWIHAIGKGEYDESGKAVRMVGTCTDITDRKQIEETFSRTFYAGPLMMSISDIETGKYLDVNNSFTRISGFAREEAIGKTSVELELVSPVDLDIIKNNLLRSGKATGLEIKLRKKDGTEVWCNYTGEIISYSGKKMLMSIAEDITNRKLFEEKLLASESMYRKLFDSSPIALMDEDFSKVKKRFEEIKKMGFSSLENFLSDNPDELLRLYSLVTIVNVNQRCVELLGAKDSDKVYRDLSTYFTEESLKVFCNEMIALFNGKNFFNSETYIVDVLGKPMLIDLFINILPGYEESLSKILVSFIDITEKRKAEFDLLKQQKRIKTLFDGIMDAIFIADPDSGIILDCNDAATALTGRSRKEIIGTHQSQLHPQSKINNNFSASFKKLVRGEGKIEVDQVIKKDGTIVDVSIHATFIEIGDKTVIQGVFRDISEIKKIQHEKEQVQAQLIHSAKLASIGTLAAGVAHEINNPLAIIKGNVDILNDHIIEMDEHEDVEEYVEIIKNQNIAINRISKIVNGLRSFSRSDTDIVETVDVNKAVRDTLALCETLFTKRGLTIVTHLCFGELHVQGNAGKLQQVILNLLTNAKDACGTDIKNSVINIETVNNGPIVILKVSDNGTGIAKEHLDKIFDPFFTTKPLGQGTGLGLSISYSIIQAFGGTMTVETEVGFGTTFTVNLPSSN